MPQDKRFFRNYGIDIEIIYVRSGTNQVAALVTEARIRQSWRR
jgi:hypothetical protein